MTPQDRSNEVSRIQRAARELPASDRLAYVQRECAGDEALQRELESLLAWNDELEPIKAALAGDAIAAALPGVTASTTLDPNDRSHHAIGGANGQERFTAGTVFAGRFRIVAALGRGGMGEVYRVDDLELRQTVALKFLTAFQSDDRARDRLRAEVRVARQIAHPNVCRVYDIGESEGRLYLTMEYVEGEDLAALLRRIGRLGSEKTIEIARKLAAGLAAAHARGVIHRDLKPHNIMIDGEGEIRIMDFGIAVVATELRGTETVRGTPAYMAPEQLAGGELSPRSDIYALGLVLYELCTGKRPVAISDPQALLRLRQGALPVVPSALVPDLDPALERVILRCLDPDPHRRPASALSVATELSGEPRKKTWRVAALIGVVSITVALAAIVYVRPSWLTPRQAATLTNRDALVVADFENRTGEPLFDGALKVALAVALEQSPFLSIYPEARARETLRLMQRSPDEPVTRSIAREIAQRERLKALLAGSITRLGGNYALTLEAIDAGSGDVLAREQAEAAGKEQVLTSLGAAAARLREKLGESLASIEKFDVLLPRATTASLDALHAYALALEQGRETPRLETIPHLKRAIELDPTFAMAYAQLSSVYTNNGQSALAPPFSRRAFELRDRVSERERFYISWRYYVDAQLSLDEALDLARSWTESYPYEAFAFNSLGLASTRLGDFEQAVRALGEARSLDARLSVVHGNLARALRGLNRTAEARAVLQAATNQQVGFINVHPIAYSLAFLEGDEATMAELVKQAVGAADADLAFGWPGRVLAYRGRVIAAHGQFGRGIRSAEGGGLPQLAAELTLESAEIHAIAGQCREVSNEAAAGLELSREYFVLVRATRALALCGAALGANGLLRELSERYSASTLLRRVHRPVVEALIALRRGEPARAIEQLDAVRPYDNAPEGALWPAYLRGRAYSQLKDWTAAANEFRLVLDHRGVSPASLLHPLAHLGLARAYAAAGRIGEARTAYQTLFDIWKDADPALSPLNEARAEYQHLP